MLLAEAFLLCLQSLLLPSPILPSLTSAKFALLLRTPGSRAKVNYPSRREKIGKKELCNHSRPQAPTAWLFKGTRNSFRLHFARKPMSQKQERSLLGGCVLSAKQLPGALG